MQNWSLSSIEQPGRYLGGELNTHRNLEEAKLNICLVFPDLYEIGISYHGFQILYHLFNKLEGINCERAYLPWADMQQYLGTRGQKLASLETGRPLEEFDVLGITLQTELHYPGVLKILDLAGIPRKASERQCSPMVIGGGPCAFHPEPIAPFFDGFLLGDGEEAVPEISEIMGAGDFKKLSYREKWEAISKINGMYVPSLFTVNQSNSNIIRNKSGFNLRVKGRVTSQLKPEFYPDTPIVPLIKGVHDRLTVELMRGCTKGCRFCQAGNIHRPLRERPVRDIINQVQIGLESTGWNEIGLLSLSTSDYSQLVTLLEVLASKVTERRATFAFPSLRPGSFTEEIAKIDTGGKRTSLTFAVEAGSERLRGVINKSLQEEELFEAVTRAFKYKWRAVKLYLMVGLPTETEEDIEEGAELLKRISQLTPRGKELRVSVAPFIPKPHSVFEREAMFDADVLKSRQWNLLSGLDGRWIKKNWRDVNESLIEAILSRGDRRFSKVIEYIADSGSCFESWGGLFSEAKWFEGFDKFVPDWMSYASEFAQDDPVPWQHLSKGFSRKWMREDLQIAYKSQRIEDCRNDKCYDCGLMKECEKVTPINDRDYSFSINSSSQRNDILEVPENQRYRLTVSKLGSARYLGHHDFMTILERSLRMANVPLRLSQGFNPRPKLSYGPALSLGIGTLKTWMEFETYMRIDTIALLKQLKSILPKGIKPWTIREKNKTKSEQTFEETRTYRIRLRNNKKLTFDYPALQLKENGNPISSIDLIESNEIGNTLNMRIKKHNNRFSNPGILLSNLVFEEDAESRILESPEILTITLMQDKLDSFWQKNNIGVK